MPLTTMKTVLTTGTLIASPDWARLVTTTTTMRMSTILTGSLVSLLASQMVSTP